MRDTGNQVVLGTFTSTFLYCLLVLRTVRGLEDDTYVPHLSVTVGVFLAVASLGVLIFFIHHVAESIQVSHIIDVVGKELDGSMRRLFPERIGSPAQPGQSLVSEPNTPIRARSKGYVQAVDSEKLLSVATRTDVALNLIVRPGDYVIPGETIAVASSELDDAEESDVRDSITLGRIRTTQQDAAFAFLQIAEIAIRALSPGVNDPFTAVTCIDRITAGMCILADRSLPDSARLGDDGTVRLITRPFDYTDLVTAGYGHIRENATGQRQVSEHLRNQIRRVLQRATDERFRMALEKEMDAIG
jgi:uncharacterized membrane protein